MMMIVIVVLWTSQNILLLQSIKQSRDHLIMSDRLNKIILSLVYSGTLPVYSTMHVESVADHSRRKVWRQQNYVVHMWTFLRKAPSNLV